MSKKIKSDNFTRSNREKSNIDIAILENESCDNYFAFWSKDKFCFDCCDNDW